MFSVPTVTGPLLRCNVTLPSSNNEHHTFPKYGSCCYLKLQKFILNNIKCVRNFPPKYIIQSWTEHWTILRFLRYRYTKNIPFSMKPRYRIKQQTKFPPPQYRCYYHHTSHPGSYRCMNKMLPTNNTLHLSVTEIQSIYNATQQTFCL